MSLTLALLTQDGILFQTYFVGHRAGKVPGEDGAVGRERGRVTTQTGQVAI